MYKLISSDFDGTLIDDEEAIPLSTVLAIDKVRRSGIKFVISTGRVKQSILDYNKDFHFVDYVISCNGAHIYDVVKKKDLFSKKMTKKTLKHIEKHFRGYDIEFCTDKDWIPCYNEKVQDETFSEWIKNNDDIHQVIIKFSSKKEALLGIEKIKDLKLDATAVMMDYSPVFTLEVTPKGITKYTAIKTLMKHLKLEHKHILAIGDSNNDIELLKNIEHSVSVGNATKEVKEITKYSTASNNEKGVEKIIQQLIPME